MKNEILGNGNGQKEQSELKLVSVNSGDLITPDSPKYPRTRTEWATFPVEAGKNKWGEYLKIGDWIVMMEWEKPIEKASIQTLAQRIQKPNPTFLVGGEGLGYSTEESLIQIRNMGGGNLLVVELHPKVVEMGKTRVSEFMKNTRYALRRRINVQYIEGDFQEVIKNIPDNSIDAARIDLFPLSADEKDIDSFRHMRQVARVLTYDGSVVPFVGHPFEPTDQQLSFLKDEKGSDLFRDRNYKLLFVNVPPKSVCPYYQGNTMVIGRWSIPNKGRIRR